FAIDREMATLPAIQAVDAGNPDRVVAGGQYGGHGGAWQTLFGGERRNGKVAKPVEAVLARHPDIAFRIFKQAVNLIAREPAQRSKRVSSSLVQMPEPLPRSSNPQTSVAVAEHPVRMVLPWGRKRMQLIPSIDQLPDTTRQSNPECAIVTF